MIGNLVVVKGNIYTCMGKVVEIDENDGMLLIKILHMFHVPLIYLRFSKYKPNYYWVYKSQIIKKSSRPVKMKQQLGLEEQQPITL